MHKAVTDFTIKRVSEDQRIIEGIATTPSIDLAGDVVVSEGAEFKLPIPLLLDHSHADVVGEVEHAEVTASGIKFRARISKIAEPGPAKDLVDKAWSYVKHGLRKSVSIGFRAIETKPLARGGLQFLRWRWFELSLVGIPAQPDAIVTSFKSAHRCSVVRLSPADRAAAVVRCADGITRSTDLWAIATFDHLPSRRLTEHEKQVVRQFREWNLKALDEKVRRARLGLPEPVRVVRLNAHDKASGRARSGNTRVVRL